MVLIVVVLQHTKKHGAVVRVFTLEAVDPGLRLLQSDFTKRWIKVSLQSVG